MRYTMPIKARIALLVAIGALWTAAAIAQQTPANERLVRQALAAAAQGQCPASIMTVTLKAICDQQQPNMSRQLSQRGSITGIEFLGIDTLPSGPAEIYRVNFQSGSMLWAATSGPDGKLMVLWSPG